MENKCMICDKEMKKMKEPFENNWDKGVDILLFPFYGSNHANIKTPRRTSGYESVKPTLAVICDDCYEKKYITN